MDDIFDDNYLWSTLSPFFDADSLQGWDNTYFFGHGFPGTTDVTGLTVEDFQNVLSTNESMIDLNPDVSGGVKLDLDAWKSDWLKYFPTPNKKDFENIQSTGAIDKKQKIAEIFNKGYESADSLYQRALLGDNTLANYVNDKAIAAGRFEDFEVYEDLKDFTNAYETDLYNVIGETMSLGAGSNFENYIVEDTGFVNPDDEEISSDNNMGMDWVCAMQGLTWDPEAQQCV
tara:strand:- start:15281 stop:15970 length:690 start_codon:yes stop_codon:yes gene_type:complete